MSVRPCCLKCQSGLADLIWADQYDSSHQRVLQVRREGFQFWRATHELCCVTKLSTVLTRVVSPSLLPVGNPGLTEERRPHVWKAIQKDS